MAAAEQDRGLQSASQLDETTPAPTRNSQTLGSLVRETATVAAAVDEAAAEQPASGETAVGAAEDSEPSPRAWQPQPTEKMHNNNLGQPASEEVSAFAAGAMREETGGAGEADFDFGGFDGEAATVAAAVEEAAAEQPASGETAGGAEEVSALAAGAMLEGLRDWPDESDWGEVGDGLDFSDFDVASGFDSVQDASSEVAFQSDTLNALAESQQSSSMGQKQVNALEANDSDGSEGDEVANCLQKLQSSLGNALGLKPATAAKLTELVKVFGVFHTPVILT